MPHWEKAVNVLTTMSLFLFYLVFWRLSLAQCARPDFLSATDHLVHYRWNNSSILKVEVSIFETWSFNLWNLKFQSLKLEVSWLGMIYSKCKTKVTFWKLKINFLKVWNLKFQCFIKQKSGKWILTSTWKQYFFRSFLEVGE